ncbi:MAG: hypothetical protein ACK6AD_02625 [Cyanobacteriota bacterium]
MLPLLHQRPSPLPGRLLRPPGVSCPPANSFGQARPSGRRPGPMGCSRPGVSRDPAYLLPLAAGAAGLLLLLGLSLQGLALQERLQVNALERLRREEDLLASAAHQLLATLNGSHRCLLPLPLARWEVEGAVCASPAALAALRRMEVWAVPVRLLTWQPGADGWSTEMELQLEAAPGRAARRGRYAAQLAGVPPQALDLRSRELGGPLP